MPNSITQAVARIYSLLQDQDIPLEALQAEVRSLGDPPGRSFNASEDLFVAYSQRQNRVARKRILGLLEDPNTGEWTKCDVLSVVDRVPRLWDGCAQVLRATWGLDHIPKEETLWMNSAIPWIVKYCLWTGNPSLAIECLAVSAKRGCISEIEACVHLAQLGEPLVNAYGELLFAPARTAFWAAYGLATMEQTARPAEDALRQVLFDDAAFELVGHNHRTVALIALKSCLPSDDFAQLRAESVWHPDPLVRFHLEQDTTLKDLVSAVNEHRTFELDLDDFPWG